MVGPSVIQLSVLQCLNVWDDQESIEQVKALGSTWKAASTLLTPIPLNPAALGYYRANIHSSLFRFLSFLPQTNTVIDFLSTGSVLPECFSKPGLIDDIREMVPLMRGNLGVGEYKVRGDIVSLDVCYGKCVCLRSEVRIADRRTLISATKLTTFVFHAK